MNDARPLEEHERTGEVVPREDGDEDPTATMPGRASGTATHQEREPPRAVEPRRVDQVLGIRRKNPARMTVANETLEDDVHQGDAGQAVDEAEVPRSRTGGR